MWDDVHLPKIHHCGVLQELPEGRGIEAPAVLAAADASSKQSILDTFPLVFCLRWLILRNEVCWLLICKTEPRMHSRALS